MHGHATLNTTNEKQTFKKPGDLISENKITRRIIELPDYLQWFPLNEQINNSSTIRKLTQLPFHLAASSSKSKFKLKDPRC